MSLKNAAWRFATVVTVMLIILNPEMMALASFIDVVGLEMFLVLVEVQMLAIAGMLLNDRLRSALAYLERYLDARSLSSSFRSIRESPSRLFFAIPSQATLMHVLVFSAVSSSAVLQ